MGKKLANSLLLMAVVTAMMLGGGMVQEGREEMWVDTSASISLSAKQINSVGTTGSSENYIHQIANITTDEVVIRTNNCSHAHGGF